MEKETKKPAAKKAEKGSKTGIIAAIIAAVVVIIVVIVICIVSSTGGSKLVGRWYYGGSHTSYYYEFDKDGTGVYGYGNVEGGKKFTYTDNTDSVVIKYEDADNEQDFKYIIDGDTLTIKDSFDNDVVYKK